MKRLQFLKNAVIRGEPKKFRTDKRLSILNEYGDEPKVIRCARAFEKLLNETRVYIYPQELIVGARTIQYFPEYLKVEEKIDENMGCIIEKGNCIIRWASSPSDENKDAFIVERGKLFNLCPNYGRVLKKGLRGIIEEAKERKKYFEKIGDKPKKEFLDAVIIANSAAIDFAKRYADEAKKLAVEEKDERRKKELLKIYEVCMNVPENPARDFWEALQSLYFAHMFVWSEDHYHVPLGRLDQLLYPYYKKDVESGKLTREEAKELIGCFLIKLNWDTDIMPGIQRGDNGRTLVLGGCRSIGCLDAKP